MAHPFEVFPILVWEEIMNQLDDASDKVSLMKCDPELEMLFYSKRDQWLLASVIPIVIDNLPRCNDWHPSEQHVTFQTSFMTCRKVSSLTCKAVDKSVESFWDRRLSIPLWHTTNRCEGNFMYGFGVRHFLQTWADQLPQRSPIVSKFITMECPFYVNNVSEEERVEVLVKVGSHVKGMNLYLEHHNPGFIPRSRSQLELILSFTPNLVYLSFGSHLGDPQMIDNIPSNRPSRLRTTRKVTLPELPFLKRLVVKDLLLCEFNFLGLEKYFPQLVCLSMELSHWKWEYELPKRMFPNLVYLEITNKLTWFIGDAQAGKTKVLMILEMLKAPKLKQFRLSLSGALEIPQIALAGVALLNNKSEESNWQHKTTHPKPLVWEILFFKGAKTDSGTLIGWMNKNGLKLGAAISIFVLLYRLSPFRRSRHN